VHIVVVCSHPDEEVLRFGGTIATHVKQGHKATIIVTTEGGIGHSSMPVEQLKKVGTQEAIDGGKVLGADVIVLDFDEQWIPTDPLVVARALIDPLRALKPDILLTHDPTGLPGDQSNTARGAIMAAERLYLPLLVTQHAPAPIPDTYYLPENNQKPDIYIDITDVIETRIASMRCFRTQIETSRDLYWDHSLLVRKPDPSKAEEIWINNLLKLPLRWGKQSGAEYAEAYVAYRSPWRKALPTLPFPKRLPGDWVNRPTDAGFV
jgi:LmbE family N-acetylglucosaminyl deacetylase